MRTGDVHSQYEYITQYWRVINCTLHCFHYRVIALMKMGLFTNFAVCTFVCVLFIKLLSVDAACSIHCPAYQYNPLLPYCYINDEEGDNICSISVRKPELTELLSDDWEKVNLFINVTNSGTLLITSYLSDYEIEIRAFRDIDQVVQIQIMRNYMIMSHHVLYRLRNLRHISCNDVAFSHFPPFSVNSELTSIGISGYTILSNDPIIRNGRISGLSNLKFLQMSPRNGSKLAKSALSGLTALTLLSLGNIVSDYATTLSPLSNLKFLSIHHSTLSDITFFKQTPRIYDRLIQLQLSYNKISSFPDDTFENYTKLVQIEMGNNEISAFNRFRSKVLEYIDFQGNQITRVAEDAIRDLPQLEYITLSSNDITTLSSRTFEHSSNFKSINLRDNPLHCDCSLQWMYNVNQEYSIDFYESLCATPSQHEGKSALNASLYTNCREEQSYKCFDSSITCPVGSYCQDTRDSYECVCEGDGIGFSKSLNQCVDYESSIVDGICCESFESNDKNHAVCT